MIEIPVIAHELLRAATGHPIRVRTLDGDEALLRLATPDELQQFEREARVKVEAMLGEPLTHEPMTRQRAEELAAPLALS